MLTCAHRVRVIVDGVLGVIADVSLVLMKFFVIHVAIFVVISVPGDVLLYSVRTRKRELLCQTWHDREANNSTKSTHFNDWVKPPENNSE